jgi:hypothetical protein
MESQELLCTFREDAVDDVAPYLWSDREVYRYINDAYFMFVRLTGGIADGSSAVTQITAATGVATTAIDPSIMRFRTATNTTNNNQPLRVINVQDVDNLTAEDYGIIRSINQIDVPGPVQYMIIGEEEDYVRWVNVPVEDTAIQLVVERLPATPITRSRQKFTGVREEHHYHLLKWVRHLAYRKQDADTFDLVKSDQERDDFTAYCDFAKREKGIRKHKVRVVRYGGL